MKNTWKHRRVKDRLIKDLEESTLSFADLGKKYGVSRQAVFGFCQRKGINRPKRPKREHTQNCSICQSIISIAKKPHSDFISSQTIKEQLGLGRSKWLYHIGILRKKGLISLKFGRLQSQKVERAYQLYFKKRLPVRTIGRQVGFKNFYAIIKEHRALGWDVPKPLFTYDSGDRKRTIARMNRNKKRMMKALKTLTVFFGILLMGSLAIGQPTHQSSEFKAGSEPDGFRGIKWGADITRLKDLTLVMTIDNDTKRYKRDGDSLRMGEVKLSYIHYEFWKGIFYLVDIGFEGAENWNSLRARMFATFGKGQSQSEEGDQLSARYRWEGEKTTIIMIYDASMGGGLTISSTEITNQRAKEERE